MPASISILLYTPVRASHASESQPVQSSISQQQTRLPVFTTSRLGVKRCFMTVLFFLYFLFFFCMICMNNTLLISSIYPDCLHSIHLSSTLVGRKVHKFEVIEELDVSEQTFLFPYKSTHLKPSSWVWRVSCFLKCSVSQCVFSTDSVSL